MTRATLFNFLHSSRNAEAAMQQEPARCARRIRAEAAMWIARLHAPDRTDVVDAGLRRWIAEHPSHAAAFERATDAWNDTEHLTGRPYSLPRPPRLRRPVLIGLATGLALSVAIVVYVLYHGMRGDISTDLGEQRTQVLEDGTTIQLNTNSCLLLRYDKHTRRVVLKSGEAYFNVAKDQQRPFVVAAGDQKVIAMGTSFLVRRQESPGTTLTVTLLEGRVAVAPLVAADVLPSVPTATETVIDRPGERARFGGTGPPALDTPPQDRVTGWMRGELIFDDTPLLKALDEINRYSRMKVVAEFPEAAAIRVKGMFRAGDSPSFARAVARSNHLYLFKHDEELVLEAD